MDKVTVYVDGFNFYYSLKRMRTVDPVWKSFYWIDFVKFFELFLGNNQVLQKVVYFTTPPLDLQKSNRQGVLFKANKLLNGKRFEVVKGKFIMKELVCPRCHYKYIKPEEKQTDVNISVQMMRDCALDNVDTIILVTADSDLLPPLKTIKKDHPNKRIKIYFPPKGFSNDLNNFLKTARRKPVLLERAKPKFLKSVMPDTVTKGNKSYTIPPEWKI